MARSASPWLLWVITQGSCARLASPLVWIWMEPSLAVEICTILCTTTSAVLVGLAKTRMSPWCRLLTPTFSVITSEPIGMVGTMLPVMTCSE